MDIHVLKYCLSNIIKNKAILGYENDDKKNNEEKQNECDIANCYLTERHEREKIIIQLIKNEIINYFSLKKIH